MNRRFEGKSVVIIGASGGLGAGFAAAFEGKGARLLLVGRNEQKVMEIRDQLKGEVTIATVDITDHNDVIRLVEFAKGWSDQIDVVINATGCDVRKSLELHTYEEIKNTLDVNLLGAVHVSKAFIPLMTRQKGSTIVHMGGFGDGRMAFPYYGVDAASRAGIFTFIEAMNRELKLEGNETRLTYFCPSPADTDAERPFHLLWRQMGIKIEPVEKVAEALIKTIEKNKAVGIMGGGITVLFSKLNAVWPQLADVIALKNYGKQIQSYLYGKKEGTVKKKDRQKSSLLNRLAIVLVVLSFIFYRLIAVVPFTPLELTQKMVVVPVLIASGEIAWWIGVVIVGKQVLSKYKKYLNPCNWCRCKVNNH